MTVTATPAVTVAGQTIAAAAPGGLPPLVAVDALSVTWGRASLLEQPTPARAALTVLDTSPGRPFARSSLVGQPVVIGWTGSDGSSGVSFRGRITDAPVRRYVSAGQTVSGAVVELTCSSLEVDLANYKVPAASAVWPAETFAARLARILALLPAGLLVGATLHPNWTGYSAGQLDASGADVLALLRKLYDSTARALVYDPAANAFTYAPRHFIAAGAAGGSNFITGRLARQSSGLWAADAAAVPMGGSWLDATELGYDGEAARNVEQMVTQVDLQWLNGAASATSSLPVVQGIDEGTLGRRTLSVDTMHATAAGAADCLAEWASLVYSEGSVPRLEPVTYATARAPFRDGTVRANLLAGCEQAPWWFVRGSWLPEAGVSPVVAFSGSTITYRGGQWSIALQPAATWNANNPDAGHGVTAGTVAAAGTVVRLVDCDPSLTVGDLGYVQSGAGF